MADNKGLVPIRPSLQEWIVPVPKGEHESRPVPSRMQDWMIARIQETVEITRKEIPAIKSTSDFIRVACWRLLKDLEPKLKDKSLSNRMAKEEIMLKVAIDVWEDERFEDHLKQIEQRVESLEKRKAFAAIPKMLRETLAKARGIDDDYWRERWVKMFNDKFSEWLKKGRISNHPKDAEREE